MREMKLTAITLEGNGRRLQVFAMLPTVDGKTILPSTLLDKYLKMLTIQRGDGYSIG